MKISLVTVQVIVGTLIFVDKNCSVIFLALLHLLEVMNQLYLNDIVTYF